MTKTEILRQLSGAANARHIEYLATQIEALRQAKMRSVEDLAQVLEPLAQAMAVLEEKMEASRRAWEEQEVVHRTRMAELVQTHVGVIRDLSRVIKEVVAIRTQEFLWQAVLVGMASGAVASVVWWLLLA